MELWLTWYDSVKPLRAACLRYRTFLWMCVVLMGFTIRCGDLAGVTSMIRVLGLVPCCYDRMLDFLHGTSLNLTVLLQLWVKAVLQLFPVLEVNGRYVLVGDGIKVAKEGKKMPAVKRLHQESDSNCKAEYIMGHSCQAIGLLVGALESVFSVPLVSRIHEGILFSCRDKRTLLDKMLLLLKELALGHAYYFVADAYYASSTIITGLLKENNHLITRVRSNAVAYHPVTRGPEKTKRGRPKKYGGKVKLKTVFNEVGQFENLPSPLLGEKQTIIKYKAMKLYWRQAGVLVQFVFVTHPRRGRIILLCTDCGLTPVEIIRLYSLRFKIEVSFKQTLNVIGTYTYHFWMKIMKPTKRGDGNKYLHKEPEDYRKATKRKINAYHRYMQLGLIAQGLLQYLAITKTKLIWKSFGSWIRTIRPGIPPSEWVTSTALKYSLPEFIAVPQNNSNLKKFLRERIDLGRMEGLKLVA